jgi:hypothetical protein
LIAWFGFGLPGEEVMCLMMDTMRFSMAMRPFMVRNIMERFCKRVLWGQLDRLGTRVRGSSIMGTNTMVRECKGEVGKYLTTIAWFWLGLPGEEVMCMMMDTMGFIMARRPFTNIMKWFSKTGWGSW